LWNPSPIKALGFQDWGWLIPDIRCIAEEWHVDFYFPVLSFYFALFARFWLMREDSAHSKDFACSKDFAGSKEDIKLKYINKDLDCVNFLIIFFSNIYITATFTSLEWGKKSIDCQIIFLKLSYWSSGFLRLVTNNNKAKSN